MEKNRRKSRERRLSEVKHSIESAQHDILQHCKLIELKDELKLKFQEIRDLYNQKSDKRKKYHTEN